MTTASVIRRATIPIHGVVCWGSQARNIEQALDRLPGVTWVTVNAATEMAYVQYCEGETSEAEIVVAIEKLGCHAGRPTNRS